VVLVAALLAVLPGRPAHSAPTKESISLRLSPVGEMRLAELSVEAGAVIDDGTMVLVGTTYCDVASDDPNKHDPDRLDPNGAIVDLAKKKSQQFTNGHKAGMFGVSVGRGRVATASNHRDPVLRVWDLKAKRPVAAVEIEQPGEDRIRNRAGVAWFHKSDRVVIAVDKKLVILDPAKPDDREELALPPGVRGSVKKPVVSPNDAWIVCTAGQCELVIWDVATKKATKISILPEKVDDPEQWFSRGVAFGPRGPSYAWRGGSASEVPEKVAEADVPAARRGLVGIDLPRGTVIPLGMGTTISTMSCAIDPTGAWLAVAGSARPDKPGLGVVGELRVYHLPSKEVTFREQLEGLPLMWVAFTPSGKRLVTATYDGVVRWWDVQGT
jgi:WD40 repeat protein